MKNTKLITLALVLACLFMNSCVKEEIIIVGNGNIISKSLNIDPFSKIVMNGADKVLISYGEKQSVSVIGDSNIINRIETDTRNKTWTMELERGTYRNYELTFHITLPAIEDIISNGIAMIKVEDFIHQEDFSVTLNGTGNFDGFNLPTDNCTVEINGLGSCQVSAENNLYVTIAGAGKVYYKGDAKVIQHISGLGSVKHQED